MRKTTMRKAAVVGAIAAVGLTGTVATAGDADAARLPNGSKTTTGIDGQVVKIKRVGESARTVKSVNNNGTGRGSAVSGTYSASLSKGQGVMNVGYLVGCQVDIAGLELGLSGGLDLAGSGSLSGALSLPLTPGQVAYVKGDNISIKKDKATIMVDSFHISVSGCGGASTARSVVQVMAADGFTAEDGSLSGDSGFVQSTLYGTPFRLG